MGVLDKLRALGRPSREDIAARGLFTAAMTAARDPGFYEQGGVSDTVDGRFDLVVAHIILVMRRLRAEGPQGADLAQRVLDMAFANFDEALREMGVGDLSVPKKVKKMAEAFYGRAKAYEEGLASGGAALDEALRRNLFRGHEVEETAFAWSRAHFVAFERRLAATGRDALLAGELEPAGAAV